MIKKSIFGLFIGFISIINFSSAWNIGERVQPNGRNFTILNNGVFSSYNGDEEIKFQPIYINSLGGFFWNDNKLYCYNVIGNNQITLQGYINKYGTCNYNGSTYMSCASPDDGNFNNNYDINTVGEFLKNIGNGDKREQWLYSSDNPKNAFMLFDEDTKNAYIFQCINEYIETGNLINTSNYEGYNSLNSNLFGNPPLYGGTNNRERNSNNYYCPTIGQLLKNYGENYNTGLCYNSTIRYDNGQITTVEKQDILTTFEDYNDFTNRTSIYNNNCKTPNTIENCQNAFTGEREKYSIIANAINNNVRIKDLWNYCNMSLNYDPNRSTCTASGYITEQPTEEEFIEMITNGEITNISTPGSGNILNNLLGTGQTRDDIATRDILGQLNQLKEKLGSIFNERNGTNGIIPDYIMWIILTTLLLTVLLKK